MNVIPSNFSRYDEDNLVFETVSLSKQRKWIHSIKVPYDKSVNETFREIFSLLSGSRLLFDGCSFENKEYLKSFGFNSVTIGKEAILDLNKNNFDKKSLKDLIRRGKRHGETVELFFNEANKSLLEDFVKKSSHGQEPQLKNLFATSFQPHHRLFVFRNNKTEEWLAAVMLSLKEKKFMQTELILRNSQAPVGIVEALIYEIYNKLLTEDIKYWSLGAVPFIAYNERLFSLSWFFNFLGRRIRFAYNYKGLYSFKNKFNPVWQPYYLCYNNSISPVQIYRLASESNLLKLIIYNLLNKSKLHYGK